VLDDFREQVRSADLRLSATPSDLVDDNSLEIIALEPATQAISRCHFLWNPNFKHNSLRK